MVIPELDAVVAMTSGVRNMQQVMNLVWDKLLPAMKQAKLPENASARKQLEARLGGLSVQFPKGGPSSPVASRVSGKWFELPENDRGIQAVSFDFNNGAPTLITRTANVETKLPIGIDTWVKSRGGFTNRLSRALSVPENPMLAASGAWSDENTFTVKIVLYETPYYSTLNFKFEGDRVIIDSEHNVAFGPTKQPQLVGQARASE
jgi:hypothetical protein